MPRRRKKKEVPVVVDPLSPSHLAASLVADPHESRESPTPALDVDCVVADVVFQPTAKDVNRGDINKIKNLHPRILQPEAFAISGDPSPPLLFDVPRRFPVLCVPCDVYLPSLAIFHEHIQSRRHSVAISSLDVARSRRNLSLFAVPAVQEPLGVARLRVWLTLIYGDQLGAVLLPFLVSHTELLSSKPNLLVDMATRALFGVAMGNSPHRLLAATFVLRHQLLTEFSRSTADKLVGQLIPFGVEELCALIRDPVARHTVAAEFETIDTVRRFVAENRPVRRHSCSDIVDPFPPVPAAHIAHVRAMIRDFHPLRARDHSGCTDDDFELQGEEYEESQAEDYGDYFGEYYEGF